MGNTTSTVLRTANSAAGMTLIEEYLETDLLTREQYRTVLADPQYASNKNLPKRSGQSIKFTRKKPGRLPEVAAEGKEAESGDKVAYEQILAPMEYINDWTSVTKEVEDMGWLNVAQDAKDNFREAIRRYSHYGIQAAFHVGRYKPGKRNSAGATVGDAAHPHFWTTPEATVTTVAGTFRFAKAPRYYTGGAANFAALGLKSTQANCHTMDDYVKAKVRVLNAFGTKIKGGVMACISESILYDLMKDDDYFNAAIRSDAGQRALRDGDLIPWKGVNFRVDDEPFTIGANATQGGADNVEDIRASWGYNHVGQVFAMDAFGFVRLGGKNSVSGTTFKVQDLTKTGAEFTIGYRVPWQALILNPAWCAEIIGPVSVNEQNNSGVMIPAD